MSPHRNVWAFVALALLVIVAVGGAYWLAAGLLVALVLTGLLTVARRAYNRPDRVRAREWMRTHPGYPYNADLGKPRGQR